MEGSEKESSSIINALLKPALIGISYLLAFVALTKSALTFATSAGISPWYPSPALSLTLLITCGLSYAPVVLLGLLIANLLLKPIPSSTLSTLIAVVIKTVGYSTGALFLRRIVQIDPGLKRLRDVSWMVLTALVAPFVVAALVVLNLAATGRIAWADYTSSTLTFWIGDTIGVITLLPFLLVHGFPWVRHLAQRSTEGNPELALDRRTLWEITAEVASILFILWLAFGSSLAKEINLFYLCFLPSLWIALRHGFPGATLGTLGISIGFILMCSVFGLQFLSLVELQILMLSIALMSLLLGAVVTERRQAEEALQQSKKNAHALLDAITESAMLTTEEGTVLAANKTTAQRAGADLNALIGSNIYDWLEGDVAEGRRAQVEQVIQSRNPARFEDERQGRIIDNSIHPIFDKRGNVTKLAIFEQDITKQRQAMEDLRISNRFLEIANRHTPMPLLLKEIVFEIKNFTACSAVGIRILDEDGRVPYEAYEGFSQRFYESENPLSIKSDQCMCIDVIKGETDPTQPFFTEGGSFHINHASRFLAAVSEEEKGQTRNVCNEYGYESVALIPIRAYDRIMGLIHVADQREDMISSRTVQRLEQIAKHLGANLRRIEVEETLWRRNLELTLFNQIGRTLSSTLDLDEVLSILLDEVRSLLDVVACSVWLNDPETGDLICRQATGPKNEIVRGWRLAPEEGLASWSARHGESLIVADTHADARYFSGVDQHTGLTLRSILTIPLKVQEQVIGVLQAVDTAIDRFKASDLKLLEPVATSAAIAIENARLYTQAQEEITKRKRAEEALQESEKRFRTMADTAPVMLWMSDTDAHCIFFNKPWLNFRGRTMKEEIGNGWVEGVHPEDRERCVDTYQTAFEARQDFRMEYRLRRSDGEYRWVMDTGTPRFTPEGAFAGYIGSCLDITERKRAEDALQRSEARYRAVVENQTDLICRFSPDTTLTFVNEAYCDYFGKTRQELLGTSFLKLLPEEDRRVAQEHVAVLTENPSITSYEHKALLPDGTIAWQQWVDRAILDAQGRVVEFQSVGRDITERKRAEEKLRRRAEELDTLQATVLDITARHNLPVLLETIVRRAARLLEASGGGLYLCNTNQKEARCVVSYNTKRDYTGTLLKYGEGAAGVVAQTKKPLIINDYRNWDERAAVYEEEQPFAAVLSAPMLWEGQVTGVLHVLQDEKGQKFTQSDLELLTLFANHTAIAVENARLYEELRTGRERLQALSQRLVDAQELERRRIARELHDEIGQTLTVVKINLQTAQSLLEAPKHETQLAHSIDAVERTLQQVRDLSLNLRPSLLDDLGLMPALRWYIDQQTQQAPFSTSFEADPLEERLPPELEIVCFRIVQEAMTNITRHAQAEQVEVEIRKHDSELEIHVRDDGVGFDVQRALKDAAWGKSLGLMSMQERAAVVGGSVEIESEPGQGSEIRAKFTLTAATPAEKTEEKES